jgi:hypothetical protein
LSVKIQKLENIINKDGIMSQLARMVISLVKGIELLGYRNHEYLRKLPSRGASFHESEDKPFLLSFLLLSSALERSRRLSVPYRPRWHYTGTQKGISCLVHHLPIRASRLYSTNFTRSNPSAGCSRVRREFASTAENSTVVPGAKRASDWQVLDGKPLAFNFKRSQRSIAPTRPFSDRRKI